MRIRSSLQSGMVLRARHTKVQNNVIRISTCPSGVVSYLAELQALSRKDSLTLLSTMMNNVDEMLQHCHGWEAQKVMLYIIIGDGIEANQLAARLLCETMRERMHTAGLQCQRHESASNFFIVSKTKTLQTSQVCLSIMAVPAKGFKAVPYPQ